MNTALGYVLIAAVVTLVVGVSSGGGWAYFVSGAVFSLSLWVMLFAGSFATSGTDSGRGRVTVRQYATAAAFAVVLGGILYVVMDGATSWAVGFIVAGAVLPATSLLAPQSDADGAV